MQNLWVVVANKSYAEIYEVHGYGKEIRSVARIDHPDGRKKDGELVSDKPGRSSDSSGTARHAVEPKTLPHEVVEHEFAITICKLLEKHHMQFKTLSIIAPPHLLSCLRKAMPKSLSSCIEKEINKDLPEYLSEKERQSHIIQYLDLWNV
ncbi:MAG: host attachment protein [Parachlamydiales bacterium]|nr:host attachment protein [Parachlamydiales bacterium]